MGDAWTALGNAADWLKVRRIVLERNRVDNGGRCQVAYPGRWRTRAGGWRTCTGVATCVHHIHGRRVTRDDIRFLVASCVPCNLRAGDPSKHKDPKPVKKTRW